MLAALLRALFFTFYRRRAAREQYFCRFIVTVRRGNNIFAILSSPRGAETISLPFYRRRAAREQYFCRFIVAVQRGNNIFAILSSPCSAETIFSRFIVAVQRGNNIFAILSSPRSARTIFLHFIVCSITASTKFFVFIFAERRCVLENGRGCACVPARTSAQRRFHTKNTRIVRGDLNDGCALAGRHGRAHRHRPYQTPSYLFAPSH